jgi:hypothetical protein
MAHHNNDPVSCHVVMYQETTSRALALLNNKRREADRDLPSLVQALVLLVLRGLDREHASDW